MLPAPQRWCLMVWTALSIVLHVGVKLLHNVIIKKSSSSALSSPYFPLIWMWTSKVITHQLGQSAKSWIPKSGFSKSLLCMCYCECDRNVKQGIVLYLCLMWQQWKLIDWIDYSSGNVNLRSLKCHKVTYFIHIKCEMHLLRHDIPLTAQGLIFHLYIIHIERCVSVCECVLRRPWQSCERLDMWLHTHSWTCPPAHIYLHIFGLTCQ